MAKIQIKNSFITSSAQITISSSLVRFSDNIRAKGITGSFSGSFAGSNLFVQGGNSFGTTALLGTNDNQPLVLETNASEKMRVTAAGLVGIGTSNPGTKLQVLGDATVGTPGSGGNLWILGDRDWRFIAGTTGYGVGSGFGLFDNTGGAYRIAVDPNGNIGIGTTSPSTPLHVFNTAATLATFTRDLATDVGFSIGADSNGTIFSTAGAHAYLFYTNGTEKMRITAGGNVGIGTTSPTAKLQVGTQMYGSAPDANYFVVGNENFSGPGPVGGITGYPATANRNQVTASLFDVAGGWESVNGYHALLRVSSYDKINSTPALTILNNGNLGLGTNSPSHQLTISRPTQASAYQVNFNTDGGISDGNYTGIRFSQGATGGTELGNIRLWYFTTGATALSLGVRNATQALYVATDGNIGIGTTNPVAKLHITGSSTAAVFYGNVGIGTSTFTYSTSNRGLLELYGATDSLIALRNSNNPFYIQKYSTNVYLNNTDNGAFILYTNNTERMRIDANGNVGIGTSNPVYKLQVSGQTFLNNGTSNALQIQTTVADTTTRDAIYLYEDNAQATGRQAISWYNGNTSYYKARLWTEVGNGYTATTFGIDVADDARAVATRLAIRNGLVGIGTTTPTARLDVAGGGLSVSGWSNNNSGTTGGVEIGWDGSQGIFQVYDRVNANYEPILINGSYTMFYVSGTERARLTSTGNLGIGTTSASRKLIVFGDAAIATNSGGIVLASYDADTGNIRPSVANGSILISDDSGLLTRGTEFLNGGGLIVQSLSGFAPLEVKSNGNTLMYVTSGGNVGIGTTTLTNGQVVIYNASGNTLSLQKFGGAAALIMGSETTNYALIESIVNGGVRFYTGNGTQTEKLRIEAGGNVGIGTTSPAQKFHIYNGNQYIQGTQGGAAAVNYTSFSRLIFNNDYSNTTNRGPNKITLYDDGSSWISGFGIHDDITGYYTGGNHVWYKTTSQTASTEYMRITSGGNVGIGTSSPSIKLAVDGEASFGDGSKLTLIGLDINSQVTPNFIKIRTKIPFASGAADFTINIKGFRYGSVETTSLMICWHYYLSTFYNPTISSAGSYAPTVKLSAEDWDSSGTPKVCIVLVSPGYWPKLYVESMYSSAYNDAYADGWDWVDADATGTGNNLAILSYKSNFGNSFVMLSNGSVGIGTVSPAYKLDVNGTGYFSSTLQVNSNITLSGGGDVIINDSDGTGFFASYMDSGVGYIRIDDGGTANGSLNINNGRLFVGPSTGNVGIGTTSPASLLQVGGSSGATATPTAIQMDNTFRNAVGGNTSLKFYLYRNTTNSETYGFGLNNAGGIEYHAGNSGGTTANHAFYTETTEKMRLNSSGNLGIGTSSPAYKLDVNTANDSAIRIRNGGGGANNGLALSVGSGSPWLDIIEGVEFRIKGNTYANIGTWNSGNNTKVLIDSNGNIGIGTTTPGGKLEVRTNAASNYVFSGTSTSGYTTTFTMDDTASYFGHDSGVRSLILRTNSTARLTVTGNGNVGIGTTSPAYKFELVGSGSVSIVNIAGRIRSNVGSDVFNTGTALAFTNTTSNANAYAYIGSRIDAAAAGDNAQSLIFATNATNTLPTEKLRITSTGNVGIGSAAPAYKLDVAGGDVNFATGTVLRFGTVAVLNESSNANDIYANIRVIRNMSSTIQDGMYINYNSPGTTGAHLRFYANGTSERMRIQANDGFVGIGTSAAVGRLDVYDSTDAGHVAFVRNASTGTSAYSAIVLRRNGDANGIVLFTNSSNRSTDGGAGNSTIRTDNGNLLLGAGGTTYHVLNTAGSVGIGTTSPAYRLDVNGGIASGGVLVALYSGNYNRLYEPAGNPGIYLGNNSDPANYYDNTTHYFRNRGGSSNYAIINSNGNLGIGTSSPVQKLHVVGAVYGTTYGQFGTSVASGTNSSYAVFGSNSAVVGVKINIDSNVNRNDLVVSGSTGNVGIGTSQVLSKLNAYASGSNLSVFRVDGGNGTLFEVTDQLSGSLFSVNDVSGLPLLEVFSNNRVVAGKYGSNALVVSGSSIGIGTSRPSSRLQLGNLTSTQTSATETLSLGGTFSNSAGANVKLRVYEDGSGGAIGGMSVSSGQMEVNTWSAGKIAFYRGTTQTAIIDASGNVGIGSTAPIAKLDINGTTNFAANVYHSIGGQKFFAGSGGAYSYIYTGTTALNFINGGDTSTLMTILNGGSVGIGTTSPGSKLDVNGTFRTAINNLTIFNDYIYVSPTENNTLNSAYFTNGIADMWINYAGYNNGNTQFRNFNVGNGKNSVIAWFDGTNKRMSINNGQAASYTLDVNGSIRTTSKFVQNSTTVSVSGTGQTLTLNLDTAAVYVVSMASGATITTISYTNRDNNPSVNTIMLVVKYAGSASITFTNVIWANGVAPTLTGTNGYADVFMLTSYQGGAGTPVWIGTVVSQALVSTNL
jgi:hypothetical protein